MVTSFRPKSPFLPDDSALPTVRGISDLSELYYQYGRYRLEILEERIRDRLKRLREDNAAGKKTETKALKGFLEEQEQFINRTNTEIVPDEDVVYGSQPDLGLPDAVASTKEDERAAKRTRVV